MSGEIGCHIPFNEEGVDAVLESIGDPIVRNLVQLAVAGARMKFMRTQGMSQADFESRLPLSPFDMTFFAEILKSLFSQRSTLEKLLRGESIPDATGWNV